VSQLDEVLHCQYRPVLVVNLQAEQPWRAQTAAGDYDRDFLRITLQFCIAEAACEHDDPVDAARDELPDAAIFVLVMPVAAHEQRRVSPLPQTRFDASQSFTIEWAVNCLRDDTYRQGLAKGQTSRGSVGSKVEFRDGRFDGVLQAVTYVDRAIDDP